MASQQDHETEISTPDGGIGEQGADTSAGPAFWRRGRVSGDIEAEPDDDVIVAEVIDEEPGQPSASAGLAEQADGPGSDTAKPQMVVTGPTSPAAEYAAGTRHSQQWRDIQATFVDDPSGAVRLAAQATDMALSDVIGSLRGRLHALSATTGDSTEHPDTEQLRGELRRYRELCQNLADIEDQLAQPQPA